MPADTTLEKAVTFTACEAKTSLTDSEIAATVRSVAGAAGVTDRIELMVLLAACKLGKDHGGPCASWVAISHDHSGDPATAWLRWSEKTRAIDWLAYCITGNCLLFRGHAGRCRLGRRSET
jgi:hypothetical protein